MKNHFSIGFTGSREGLSKLQYNSLLKYLTNLDDVYDAHHGMCVGADEVFHRLLNKYCDFHCDRIFIHPPKDTKYKANAAYMDKIVPVTILPPKDYLDRNKDIVDASSILVACPKTQVEELRSGTWATIRYARKTGVPVALIYPNGTVKKI